MRVKIDIPSYLQPFTSHQEVVEAEGETVGECLDHLVEQFPDMEKMLFANNRQLHGYVSVYVNGKDTYPEELDRLVNDGDELNIPYIIVGG